MISDHALGSASFRLVASGLVALHRISKDGKDDSPEADSIRDALDSPLRALSKTEKERSQWLSEDMYSVSEPTRDVGQKKMDAGAQRQFNEAIEAQQKGEWDWALIQLRELHEYVEPALLSYLRGAI
jgi:hypothetical protein